jgi:hypothetical protein
VNEEDNQRLFKEVSKDELQLVMHSFQKNKSTRLDKWPIKFFLGFYEILEEDLLREINESKVFGRMLATFNSTFIVLIPKDDSPISFD